MSNRITVSEGKKERKACGVICLGRVWYGMGEKYTCSSLAKERGKRSLFEEVRGKKKKRKKGKRKGKE